MENNKTPTEFDFDHWVKVAEQDPEKFEEMRASLINDFMEQSPEQFRKRLEGLQWQIDQVRNKSSNPMESCLAISNKMWEHFYGEKGLVSALKNSEKNFESNTDNVPNKVVPIKNYKSTD